MSKKLPGCYKKPARIQNCIKRNKKISTKDNFIVVLVSKFSGKGGGSNLTHKHHNLGVNFHLATLFTFFGPPAVV